MTLLPSHTALDAPSLVFLMRSVPGAPPTGTLRVSKSVPDGFVPLAGTCFLNQSYGYAFGRRRPPTAQICQEQIWTSAGRPQGVRHGWRTSKILRDHRIHW